MAQSSVPVSNLSGPNDGPGPPEATFSIVGAAEAWQAASTPGIGSFVNFDASTNNVLVLDPNLDVSFNMDSLIDPGINTGHVLNITLRYRLFSGVAFVGKVSVWLEAASFFRLWEGVFTEAGIIVDTGELSPCNGPTFVVLPLTLTSLEVDDFRAAGGYSSFSTGYSILCNTAQPTDFPYVSTADLAFIELEVPTPSGEVPYDITGSGGFIFGGQGLGTDYFVPAGGFEFGGEAIIGFDPLELTPEGGFIFGGSAGIGGNQIVGTGGFIFGGGGRDFLIRSPDIGGIYFLDPLATHDTFYLRDGDQGTEDVKIPDPFWQTAFLGD